MNTFRAATFSLTKSGELAALEILELKKPDLQPGEALIAVDYSEVCGTDLHLRDARLSGVPYPIIPGHVSVGRLLESRGPIQSIDGRILQPGDPLTFFDVHGSCGHCHACLVARSATRCPHRKVYGITFGLHDGPCGGWSERLLLKSGTIVLPLDGLDPLAFMRGGCALPTAIHGTDRARIKLAEDVLILGSGPVGLSLVALARMQGAHRVFCIGSGEERLNTARAMGADATIDIAQMSPEDRIQWILEQTSGRGVDCSIEAAGPAEAVTQAIKMTRDGGRLIVLGQYTNSGPVPINPHLDINRKHLTIKGCWGSRFDHFERALRLLSAPRLAEPWNHLPTKTFSLDELPKALEAIRRCELVKALVDPNLRPGRILNPPAS